MDEYSEEEVATARAGLDDLVKLFGATMNGGQMDGAYYVTLNLPGVWPITQWARTQQACAVLLNRYLTGPGEWPRPSGIEYGKRLNPRRS